jgi:hypothetical protein
MIGSVLASIDPSAEEIESIVAPIYEAIAELSLVSAHVPRERSERALHAFGARLRASWGESFAGLFDPEEIDVLVEKVINRIRKRRDEIERAAAGTA